MSLTFQTSHAQAQRPALTSRSRALLLALAGCGVFWMGVVGLTVQGLIF